jgi:hypothetical protein
MALIGIDHRTAGADDQEIQIAVGVRSLDTHTHGELTRLDEMGKRAISGVLAEAAEEIAHIVKAQQLANPDPRK